MSRFRLIVVGLMLAGAVTIYGFWPHVPLSTTIPEKEVHLTRGLKIQETPDNKALRESMERLSHESTLEWIQAGVTFNGEIPLWGLLGFVILALIAFIRLETRSNSHEKSDEERFTSVESRFTSTDDMLAEIRADIKLLLQRHD